MSRSALPVLFGLALATALTINTAAQAPQFRASTTLVPIDVYVMDERGRPVSDLKPTDFSVFEDGAVQRIAQFVPLRLAPEEPGASTVSRRGPDVDAAGLALQNRRIFLLILGRGRLQEPSKGLDGLLHLVRERLLPQDVVAVMAWNRASEFTAEHERVAQVLERFKSAHAGIESRLEFLYGLASVYGTPNIPADIQAEIDAVMGTSRTATGPSSPGPPLTSTMAFGDYVEREVQTMQDLEKVYSGINYLRLVEGAKHLILVTEHGLFLPRLEDNTSLASAASDARVAVDTVQVGGVTMRGVGTPSSDVAWATAADPSKPTPTVGDTMYVSPAYSRQPKAADDKGFAALFAVNDLRLMSRLTGGVSSISEATQKAVDRIDSTSRVGYLLGYAPANVDWNGAYRRIEVKVNRPGVSVLFRHGYYARQAITPPDRKAFLTYARIARAAETRRDIHDIVVSAQGRLGTEVGNLAGEAIVETRIDTSTLRLVDSNQRKTGMLQAAVFCVDGKGQVVGERWQRLDLSLDQPTFDRLRRDGLPYIARVPLKARARAAKLIVYDPNADLLGTVQVALK